MDQGIVGSQIFESLSGWVTAVATVVLAFFTLALVVATVRMARAMARPHVVANLEVNQWSLMHCDVVVENCGNAPAYDVSIVFNPPIEMPDVKGGGPFPLSEISLIRPGQTMVSYAAEFSALKGRVFHVEVKWKAYPNCSKNHVLSYKLNMNSFDNVSFLGNPNPITQIAEEVKKIRNDWSSVAKGQRKTKVDVYSEEDRSNAQRAQDEWLEARRQSQDQSSGESSQ